MRLVGVRIAVVAVLLVSVTIATVLLIIRGIFRGAMSGLFEALDSAVEDMETASDIWRAGSFR